jgi:hypothetical protein
MLNIRMTAAGILAFGATVSLALAQGTSMTGATGNWIVPTLQGLQQTRIVVDGYTDNVPVGPELQRMGVTSNLDLSS